MMPCAPFQTSDGTRGLACVRGRSRRRCSVCKNAWADFSCDFPRPDRKSGTCALPLCGKCKVKVGDDLDFCPHHPRETPPGPAQIGMDL